MKKRPVIFMLSLIMALGAGACSKTPQPEPEEVYDPALRTAMNANETSYEFAETETYKNPISSFDSGDPFIYRWNGKYYLFPSANNINGIRAYVSDDMVHWTAHPTLVVDFRTDTAEDLKSQNYYAPEIVYYKGAFYLCTSPNGGGHFFYKSTTDSPLGPYTRITGNVGRGIDGSFYVRDDGKLFLIHTNENPAGLRMSEVLDFEAANDMDILGPQVIIQGANLNHWIEGPGIIRRGEVSYLTYTGNHVISEGYRIAYSYSVSDNLAGPDLIVPDSFIQPTNNVNFISTVAGFSGLGHSSNAYGPDLDSIYTAYHNRNNGRRYNLDRYLTNGVRLTANGNTYVEADVPNRPDFEKTGESGLITDGGFKLSDKATGEYYTAEFNFVHNNGAAVVNYTGSGDYMKLALSAGDNTLKIIRAAGGTETVLGTVTLPAGNDHTKTTVLRVEKTLKRMLIFYNGMKAAVVDYSGAGGKIGYTATATASYTAFTDEVWGTGDFETVKNLPAKIPAHSYLKGENRGFSFADGTTDDSPRMGEKNTIVKEDGEYSVVLSKREDFVKYPVRAERPGVYSVVAEVGKDSGGAIIEVVVGEEDIYKFEVPAGLNFGNDAYIPVALGNIEIEGKTTVKIRLWKGNFKFRQLEFYEDAELKELNLADGAALKQSLRQVAAGKYTVDADNTLRSGTDNYYMALGGPAGAANFVFEADVAIRDLSGGMGGIAFRAKNYSYHADQPAEGFQGYFLQIRDRMGTLFKYDYGATTLSVLTLRDSNNAPMFTDNTFIRVKVRCLNNRITVWVADQQVADVYDNAAFMDGQVGFYSLNASFSYKNLIYRAIE